MKAKTNIKKALSLLLAVVMVCSVMTLGTLAAPLYDTTGDTVTVTVPNGTDTPDSYVCTVVTTADELKAALANGESVILGDHINMGTETEATAYAAGEFIMANGTLFEGNGYSLYNFSLSETNLLSFAGTAVVQNLTVGSEDAWIDGVEGIFASAAGTVVTYNNVEVFVDMDDRNSMGAWCGDAKGSMYLNNCIANGTVDTNLTTAETAAKGQGFGGFIGYASGTATISMVNCVNRVAVTGCGAVGGFIGVSENYAVTLRGCINRGSISGKTFASGNSYDVAGFIGFLKGTGATQTTELTSCKNYGTVQANTRVAGFIANVNSKIVADVTLDICENVGQIIATAGGAGGIFSDANGGTGGITINHAINRGKIQASGAIGGIYGSGSNVVVDGATNIGVLELNATTARIGNICGHGYNVTVKNSYCFGKLVLPTGWNKDSGYICALYSESNGTVHENNRYLTQEGFTPTNSSEIALEANQGVNAAAAVELLNTKYTDLDFAVGTDNAIYVTTPVLQGSQETVAENDLQKVRFLATINANGTALKSIGFKVSYSFMDNGQKVERGLVEGQPGAVSCEWIYKSIKAVENGVTYSYSAASLGGDYIYALSIAGVPTNKGEVTFTVTPFTVDQNDKEVTGQGWTVVYNAGEFVSATKIPAVSQ